MKILLFHATAGHGHKKVADVIMQTFHKRGLSETDVRSIDALDLSAWYFRKSYPAIYFNAVKYIPKLWGWFYENLDHAWLYRIVRPFRSFGNACAGRKLLRFAKQEKPDLIICAHFFTAELFATAKKKGKLDAKLLTVITDFFPHTFWVNEGTDYYWVMGEPGKASLKKRGVKEEQIIAGGIPVGYEFQPCGKKAELLRRWNLPADRLTLLMTSGSFGLGKQKQMLESLASVADRVQCLVVCGQNKKLKTELDAAKFPFPVRTFDFVNFMADLMEVSDLIVAKTGGATTTESLAKGVPMVVTDPIPGQETRNADYLRLQNAAFFMEKPEQLLLIVKAVLQQPQLLNAKKEEIRKVAKPNAAEDLATFVLSGFSSHAPRT